MFGLPMSKAMSEAYKAKDKARYASQAKAYKKSKTKSSMMASARRVSSISAKKEEKSK